MADTRAFRCSVRFQQATGMSGSGLTSIKALRIRAASRRPHVAGGQPGISRSSASASLAQNRVRVCATELLVKLRKIH